MVALGDRLISIAIQKSIEIRSVLGSHSNLTEFIYFQNYRKLKNSKTTNDSIDR